MAIWRFTNIEVTKDELDKALTALQEACFKCGKENHSDDCPIGIAKREIKKMKEEEGG